MTGYFVQRRLYNVKESKSKCVSRDGLINTMVGSRRKPFTGGKGERIMDGFYVTLPSDPSPEIPDNSPSCFKVRLSQQLTLPLPRLASCLEHYISA